MRKLALNASALSDAEYDLYTNSLRDIALVDEAGLNDETTYESLKVGVREVRAWLRGRYGDVGGSVIDTILKLFSPELAQTDTLQGAQFFAVLRLVLHALDGKEVDRSLVFTQARVPQPSTSTTTTTTTSKRQSMSAAAPPLTDNAHNPFTQPPLHPSLSQRPDKLTHNPFLNRHQTRSDSEVAKPPLPPRKPPPPPIPFAPPPRHVSLSSSALPSVSRNRPDRSLSPSKRHSAHPHPPPPPPPIPLTKPAHHVTSTLMKQSLQATKVAQSLKKAEEQLEKERVMQVLKSSSGTIPQPSSSTSSSKVLYPTSANTSSGSTDSVAPPLPRRRTQPNTRSPSPPFSASSMEQVALAGGAAAGIVSPFRSPPPGEEQSFPHSNDLPDGRPPPTHPDRKPHLVGSGYNPLSSSSTSTSTFDAVYGTTTPPKISTSTSNESSPTTRVFRSKSLHHHTPPSLHRSGTVHATTTSSTSSSSPFASLSPTNTTHAPPPPARRKRPESFQVLSGSTPKETLLARSLGGGSSSPSRPPPPPPPHHHHHGQVHHRRSSLSVSVSSTPSSSSYSTAATHPISEPTTSAPGTTNTTATAAAGTGTASAMTNQINPLSMAHIQRTLLTLQPKLDKARYKAEAGLSKRGFVRRSRREGGKEEEEEEAEGLVGFSEGDGDVGRRGRGRGRSLASVGVGNSNGTGNGGVREPRYFESDDEDDYADGDEDGVGNDDGDRDGGGRDVVKRRSTTTAGMRTRFLGGRSLSPSPDPPHPHHRHQHSEVWSGKQPASPLKPSFGATPTTGKRYDPPEQDDLKWPVDVQAEGWRRL